MNCFTTPTSIATRALACGLVAAAVTVSGLTGCGAGQVSQTAAQQPAINGSRGTVNNIALRDVRIQAVQTTDALRPGKTVDLMLVAANESPDVTDTLTAITTDIGRVTVTGNATVPPIGVLIVGTPDHHEAVPLQTVQAANTVKATVALTKPISNGLMYDFTFRFAHAGETTVGVPISAGPEAPRQEKVVEGAGDSQGKPH